MMFHEAQLIALRTSAEHSCTRNINGTIVLRKGDPVVDPTGWMVSDWYVDGSTVMSYHNGVVSYERS